MSIGLHISRNNAVDVGRVFKGDLLLFTPGAASAALVDHAIKLRNEYLGEFSQQHFPRTPAALQEFVEKSTQLKKRFTNGDDTKALLERLIDERYGHYSMHRLLYDVPRIRVIPNSEIIRSGIAYNYQPHRDTWYAGGQSQVNHWLSVQNVSMDSSFYIAPTYFSRSVENSSKNFDLDEWDTKFRPAAEQSIESEKRPHPSPLVEIPDADRMVIDMGEGSEIAFSGNHLHGSSPNTTQNIRLSIDYRVYIPALEHLAPANVDNKSTGDYRKLMVTHPKFG